MMNSKQNLHFDIEQNTEIKDNLNNLANILDPSDENILKCADDIKNGKVVGFPTETVYGLGANALNVEAVKKIFEYKGRPLSDPLIVHVTSLSMAKEFISIDENTFSIFKLFAEKFWPGPLTMVLRANFNIISPILTAGTDYIGIRYPNNEIAQKLINFSQCPIAAPSANKFCHISPVNPVHVYEDFKEFPVNIINGGVCSYRMESTVIKIISEDKKIQVLRMGAISSEEIETFLKENNIDYTVEIYKKKNIHINNKIENLEKINEEINKEIDNEIKNFNPDDIKNLKKNNLIKQEAPGQFLKHYSPKLETFIYDEECENNFYQIFKEHKLSDIVFLDFKKILFNNFCDKNEDNFLHLSVDDSAEEVMMNLYDFLHKAEKIKDARVIIICDLNKHMEENAHKQTVLDRILKASAYKRINLYNI